MSLSPTILLYILQNGTAANVCFVYSLVTFVTNHTNGRLERWLRSAKSNRQCPEDKDATCIIEVTTGSFQEVVLDISKVIKTSLRYFSFPCTWLHRQVYCWSGRRS